MLLLLFERYRTQALIAAMPVDLVVEPFNGVEHVGLGLVARQAGFPLDAYTLERLSNALAPQSVN